MKLEFSRQIFEKQPTQISNSMYIRPEGAELFYANGQTDGRAATTKLIIIFHSSVTRLKMNNVRPTISTQQHLILRMQRAF